MSYKVRYAKDSRGEFYIEDVSKGGIPFLTGYAMTTKTPDELKDIVRQDPIEYRQTFEGKDPHRPFHIQMVRVLGMTTTSRLES
jgi:hypothetical protein